MIQCLSEWFSPSHALLIFILFYLIALFVVHEKCGICLQVPFLFGVNAFEKAVNFAIYLIFRRTGRTFFLMLMLRESLHCSDAWRKIKMKMKITSFLYYFEDEDEMPLIVGFDLYDWLCRPALRAFKRRVSYSNACHDHILFFWFM